MSDDELPALDHGQDGDELLQDIADYYADVGPLPAREHNYPRVVDEGGGVWRVRLDGGLRVDTFHGLARAVAKIPFAVRREGGSYRLLGTTIERDGFGWARIRIEEPTPDV